MTSADDRRTHRRWQVALAVAVAVNLVILFWPRAPGTGGVPGLDKAVHLATFASLAVTGLRAGLKARWWLPVLAAHAVLSEVVQATLLPHRDGDWRDAAADLLGVLAGTLLARASWTRDRSGADDADRAPARGDSRAG